MLLIILIFLLCTRGFVFQVVQVQTSFGKVQGATDTSNAENHKYSFKGIPYAKPPIGELRFQLPQPPVNWEGTLDASKYRASCMSYLETTTSKTGVSEDCLFVNIFTSQRCLQKTCPVIVFFHGGSFNAGLATQFNETFLLERYVEEDIVFVIPAFRLGVFGQFNLGDPDVTTTNLILHDCTFALNFINLEIQSFGGNPNDVTIMGHSSGGSLIDALGFSPEIDPEQKLFQKLIVFSAHGLFGFEDIQIENSFEIARRLGCTFTSSIKEKILDCMRSKNAEEIIQMQKTMEDIYYLRFNTITLNYPVIQGNGTVADLKKHPAPRKMLYGVTEHEFETVNNPNYYVYGFFMDFENPVETVKHYRKKFTNISAGWTDSDSSAVFLSAATYSEAIVNAGGDVYLFETRQKPYSMHTTDMQYIMGVHREPEHTADMDIVDTFYSKLIVNFTKFGEPSPIWEKYDPMKMNFLALEVDTKMGILPHMEDGFHRELVGFWMKNMTEIDKMITKQKQQTEPNLHGGQEHNPVVNFGWWTYVIVLIVIFVTVFLFLVFKIAKSKQEERKHLLGEI